ncbi:MAG: SET domain-containing protein [Chloroflexi bacterium]|nr:SET domain-containing protein [Chloroflexota bacterium]
MSKVYVNRSRIHGLGVFAAVTLKPGEPVLAIDDSRLVTPTNPLRPGEEEMHCDYLADCIVVLMQEPERYINHSCDPNSFVRSLHGIRYVLARKTIYIGEEITYDYSMNSCSDFVWHCDCGSARCRFTITADFFQLSYLQQLEYLPLLETWFIEENKLEIDRLLTRALGDDVRPATHEPIAPYSESTNR